MERSPRLSIMRRFAIVVALGLLVAACGADDPETEAVGTTTTAPTTTTRPSTTTTTVDLSTHQCGDTFPVFPAELRGNDLANVTGTPGPGPDSYPAADRQLVAHWEGDEYATFELRWPAEPHDYQFVASEIDTAFPATFPELVEGRVVVYMNVAPERSDPCGLLAIEAYGPRTAPLMDSIWVMLGALQPVEYLEEYLADIADRTTWAADPDDRTSGLCAVPAVTIFDEWGEVPASHKVDLIERFLSDRVAGLRASDCLTESGLATYPTAGSGYHQPPQCLFECEDGSRLVGFDPVGEAGWSAVLVFENADGTRRRMREEYFIQAVPAPDGELQAMIVNVWAQPESHVSEAAARRVISGFLDALAAQEWQVAWGYLVDEGVSQEVWERWDDPWEVDPNEELPTFCATALCNSRYEILESVRTDSFGRSMNVRFHGVAGPVDKAIGAGMFEGHISVSNLPPDGRDGEPQPSLAIRLFGNQSHGPLAVFRYDAVELINPTGSSDFQTFWPSRYLNNPALIEDLVVYDDRWGYVHTAELGAGNRVLISEDEEMHAAGAGRLGDVEYALIANVDGLFAHDPDTGVRVRLLDRADEAFVNFASIVDDLLVVSTGSGDATWFELFEISERAGVPVAEFLRKVEPAGATGYAHPSSDGQRLAYVVEETLHRPTILAVSDVLGVELDRWIVPADRVVGPIAYDGRWIIAELRAWSPAGAEDAGERLVIDTKTGSQHMVESYDLFLFR